MKKENPHTVVEYKQLAETLKKRHQELLGKHTTTTVQRIANLNFSALKKGTSIREFNGSVPNDYQESVDQIDQHIQGHKILKEQTIDEQDIAEKSAILKTTIGDKLQSLKPLKARLDEGAYKLLSSLILWKKIRVILIILSGLETIFNYQIFNSLGGNLISSLATGVLIGMSVYFYAHMTPEKVKKYGNGNTVRELGFFVLFLLPIGILFYLLADLRLNYLMAVNPDLSQDYNLSPWVFVAINIFIYLICYFLVYKFKPSKKDQNRYTDYRKALKEIQSKEEEIVQLQGELAELEPALRKRTAQRSAILLLGKQLEDEVQTAYEQCLSEMKLELLLRTDGEVNKLYTEDAITPLKFNYQSLNLPS
ncbi:MAG: hypothetical protein RLP14_08265 [Owenweeksia sp.]